MTDNKDLENYYTSLYNTLATNILIISAGLNNNRFDWNEELKKKAKNLCKASNTICNLLDKTVLKMI